MVMAVTAVTTAHPPAAAPAPRVVLHIDRLVLRGVDPSDAAAVARALQAELGRLLAPDAGAALLARGSAAVWPARPVALAPGADAAALGRAVAGGVLDSARGAGNAGSAGGRAPR